MMARKDYASMPLDALLTREWAARPRGLFACPSCGGRWYTHCQGCRLNKAISEKLAADK